MKKGITDKQIKFAKSWRCKIDPRGISFFKTYQGRHCGRKQIKRFLKLREDGSIVTVDTERNKITTLKSFGSLPLILDNSTRAEWERAYKKVSSTFK